jgi:MFS family permease
LLTAGFIMLPLQAVLTLLSRNPGWLIAVQLFGGLGTGLFVALTPLWLADATRGTGRYNVSQGAMGTLRAIGATSSSLASELLMDRFGYSAAYIGCGIVGVAALALLWFALPEVPSSDDHTG